ncbi:MAG: endonuclease [Oscillospiraceae bacterium]|nr:endonuclease [Oscillospiraceae bacterium]
MKKILKILLILVLVLVVAVAALLGWLTATEYRPEAVEAAAVALAGDVDSLKGGDRLSILSWNVGYGGLGKESDFFMDGGTMSKPKDKQTALGYLDGIARTIEAVDPDLVILQEVDADSSRTYSIDERPLLSGGMSAETYALNYSCPFVPVPVPPIGKVHSGLFTMTDDLRIDRAERISLPCPFSWPLRIANLKRCLLVSYLPIEGSDKQLVLVNLHLEAYDDGAGKIAQTNQLREFITAEYEKGNYVIAGGDFNQVFPGSLDVYANTHPELWEPGVLDENLLPEGWTLAYDLSTPTCRLLNQPYDPSDTVNTQYYVIDGLILSPNVELNAVETLDAGFAYSDHNPVRVDVTLN